MWGFADPVDRLLGATGRGRRRQTSPVSLMPVTCCFEDVAVDGSGGAI